VGLKCSSANQCVSTSTKAATTTVRETVTAKPNAAIKVGIERCQVRVIVLALMLVLW
jgi:hypothetical protein